MLRRRSLVALLALVMGLGSGALATVVEMTDGRRFEGEIVAEDATSVTIDTRVSPTIRTTLRLARADIASLQRQPLPPGFFDPAPVPQRRSDRGEHAAGAALYLEVPIKGRFGEDVFAAGVRDVLRYAGRHRIQHIVFVVDCDGGELDDVSATWDELRNNSRRFTYHAVVHKCLGGAIAIPIWCESLFVAPGARIGGSLDLPEDPDRRTEDGIMLAQIANDAVRQARLSGDAEQIVRAMIDPARILAAWRDEDGEIAIAANPPPDLPADRLIFEVDMGTALQLDDRQAMELDIEGYDGDVAGLGEVLGLEGWKRESDFGVEAMSEAVVRRRAEKKEAAAKFQEQVENNIRRREVLERNLEENMKRASEWNPSSASYDFYSRRWGWGRGLGRTGRRGGMTWESRQRWTRRTDLSLSYLLAAADTVKALERLDKEAVTLGLEPSFGANDLGWIKSDIQTKYNELMADRRRRA